VKRLILVPAALAIALLVVPSVQAEVEDVSTSGDQFVSFGGGGRPWLVQPQRAFPAKQEFDPVLRPPSFDPTVDPPGERSSEAKIGPTASFAGFSGGSLNRNSGSMLTPRGGTMSTPRQQADRAIQRVIRRLD